MKLVSMFICSALLVTFSLSATAQKRQPCGVPRGEDIGTPYRTFVKQHTSATCMSQNVPKMLYRGSDTEITCRFPDSTVKFAGLLASVTHVNFDQHDSLEEIIFKCSPGSAREFEQVRAYLIKSCGAPTFVEGHRFANWRRGGYQTVVRDDSQAGFSLNVEIAPIPHQ